MHFVLIAEHPGRTRPITFSKAHGASVCYVPLAAGTLSDAAGMSADIDGKAPLLRIRLTDARPIPNASEMVLPPRASSIVSLIHDASLLEIADGAVITTEDDDCHRTLIDSAATMLADLGYSISRDWHPHFDQDASQKGESA